MYKPINSKENKTINMKRLAISFIPIVFLIFLMGNVDAYLVNFTGSTPKELLTTVNAIDQIKGRYFNNSWFVTYTFYEISADKGNYISRWYKDYTIKQKDWYLIFGTPSTVTYIDWAINTNYLDALNDNKIIYLTSTGLGGTCKILNMTYELKNNTLTTDAGCGSVFTISLADNMVYVKQIGNTVYYGDIKSTVNGGLSFGSNGTLTLPSSFSSFTGNNTIRFLYVPSINEYWIFYPDQNNILQLTRYDNAFAYINTHQITGSGQLPNTDYFSGLKIYPDYDAVYSEKYGYIVYLAIHEYMNNTVKILALDTISTKQINNAVLVDSQTINMTVNDPLVNTTNNITALSFGYNPNTAHFNLFYAYRTTATGTAMSVLEESVSCQCSAWINTSECVNNQYRKQTRDCVPSSCTNDTIQYILDPSCQYVPPPNIENATKFFQNVSACEIHTSELGKSQKCEFNLNVPSQCLLNTVVVTLSGTILSENNQKCDQGSWNISLCNPSFSCNNYGHTCNEFNWTHEYTRYTYKANDQALLQVIGTVPTSCGSWYCGFDRVQAWILSADLKVECQTGCYNHTVCGSGQYFGYSCFERSDCYQESCTFCPLGCRENTGLCVIAGEPTIAPQLSSYANPFKFLKDTVEFSFADSTWMLTLISIFLTGGSAVFVGIKAKNWVIALIVAMGVALFFLTMGWLPSWIGIIWVLSIALLLTNMFREKFVGK